MRKVFLLSLLLVVLSLVIPWLMVTLGPAQEPAVQPIPSITASAAVAPDSETAITALSGGALVETTMAEWLPGVVAAEMPASFAPEALRAQAVAARTYILQRMRGGAANHPEAGVCDQYTCCCAHKDDAALREQWGADYARNMARIRQAVTDTDGQYLTYGGQLIRAVFHASSAGATESSAALWSGDAPYLVSVSSPETAQDVPNYVSTAEIAADAVEYLRDIGDRYDLIILDPPAFAKHHKVLGNAMQGYKRLNARALSQIRPGGILFTFSCSQAVSKELFRTTVFSAAAIAGRKVRILHQLTQPADHPINIYHPEGEYLKGLVLYVE